MLREHYSAFYHPPRPEEIIRLKETKHAVLHAATTPRSVTELKDELLERGYGEQDIRVAIVEMDRNREINVGGPHWTVQTIFKTPFQIEMPLNFKPPVDRSDCEEL